MSDLGDIGKMLAGAAIGLAADVARDQITKRQAAQRALDLAAATGIELADLRDYLSEACAARAETMVRIAQAVQYGRSEGG